MGFRSPSVPAADFGPDAGIFAIRPVFEAARLGSESFPAVDPARMS